MVESRSDLPGEGERVSADSVEAQQVVQEAPARPGGARHNAVLRGEGEGNEGAKHKCNVSCIRNAHRCS